MSEKYSKLIFFMLMKQHHSDCIEYFSFVVTVEALQLDMFSLFCVSVTHL